MTFVRADNGWLGLLIFIVAILLQAIAAMRKGKAARPPVPGTTQRRAPAPVVRRPMPTSAPAPAPWRTEPVIISAPSPSQLPPKLRELFEELSFPPPGSAEPTPYARAEVTPSLPPEPSEAEIAAAARAMEAAENAGTAPAASPAWSRLGVQSRAEWQKAFILSEVLQPPVALRPDGFARSAHF
jgi:hypothetical protein